MAKLAASVAAGQAIRCIYLGRSSGRAAPLQRLTLVVLLAIASGCATFPPLVHASDLDAPANSYEVIPTEPIRGPGAVFATVEEAAIDALAWCYLQDRRDHGRERVRGGSIRPAPNGSYTYDEIAVARVSKPHIAYFTLYPGDVAHFRYYPRTGLRVDRGNESHSRPDRGVVDRKDSLHRPSYLLTPKLAVRIYRGAGNERKLAQLSRQELARLGDRIHGSLRASQ